MRARLLAVVVVIAMFPGLSHADSCAAGPFSSLISTSCTIGDMTFTFSNNEFGFLSTLTITPLTLSSSAGFEIAGFPAAGGSLEATGFYDFFTAVPSSGMTITSFTATLNGLSQTANNGTESSASLFDRSGSGAGIIYIGGKQDARTMGGPLPSGFGTGPNGGYFQLFNYSVNGSASFTSADFVFNESATPEPATWLTFGTGLLGVLGAGWKRLARPT